MAEIALAQVAEITGVPYANLKKQAQRNQLRTRSRGGRLYVTDEDLDAYMAANNIVALSKRVVGQSLGVIAREAGNSIARLPEKVRGAILEGMPTSKNKTGGPEPFLKATAGFPKRSAAPITSDDPHFEFGVGYQHSESPRWKRRSSSTWVLGKATWTFSPDPKGGPGTWIGGGSREGATLAPGFSPANPYSEYRPLAGSETVDRD